MEESTSEYRLSETEVSEELSQDLHQEIWTEINKHVEASGNTGDLTALRSNIARDREKVQEIVRCRRARHRRWLAYIHGNHGDETSEEWSDEVHRQLRAWTALETVMQDRANAEYLEEVRSNVASYCNAYTNDVQERKARRLKQKAVNNGMRQAWFTRHSNMAKVGLHPGTSLSYDPQP